MEKVPQAPEVTAHVIPQEYLDMLADGQENPETWQLFDAIELSTRKYLLANFVKTVRMQPEAFGETSPLSDSWNTLIELERQRPKAVKELLMSPATGSWLSHVLRRLHSRDEAASEVPLWVDVGYFNSIVAASAYRNELDTTLTIPTIQGRAFLPGLGTAQLTNNVEWGTATVSSKDDLLTISDDNRVVSVDYLMNSDTDAFWRPIHEFATVATSDLLDYTTLRVIIDDADPYANSITPQPLTKAELEQWQDTLAGAWQILVTTYPSAALELAHGLSTIVPYPAREQFQAYSSSTNISIGCIRASLPANPSETAEILLHEYGGHSKLNKVLAAIDLVKKDEKGATLYAPWRDDPRPGGGLLHGVYAFSRVVDYYNRQRRTLVDGSPEANCADFERGLWSEQASETLKTLFATWFSEQHNSEKDVDNSYGYALINGHEGYSAYATRHSILLRQNRSDSSHRFMANMGDHLVWQMWPEVPDPIISMVKQAKADHKALWHAFHDHPHPAAIDTLTKAWLSDEACIATFDSVPSTIKPNLAACRLDARAILARQFLLDPNQFEHDFEDSESLQDKADRALILGKFSLAQDLYSNILAQAPLDARAFIGWGLSLPQPHISVKRVVMRAPHAVLATQARIIEKTGQAVPYPDLIYKVGKLD